MIGKQIQDAVEYINVIKATGSLFNPYGKVVEMSIEQSLERIAIATEELLALAKTQSDAPAKRGRPTKEKEVEPVDDILGDTPVAITKDDVLKALRGFMDKNGGEKTKELMIKHGADKAKPVLTTIPEKNYPALMKELGA